MRERLPSFCKFHVSGSERKGTPADGRQRGGTNYYYTVGAAERTAGRPGIAGIKIFYTFHVMLSIHRQNLISWSHQLFNYQVKWSATSCLLCVYGLDLLHASVYTRFLFPQVRLHLGGLLSTIKHRGSIIQLDSATSVWEVGYRSLMKPVVKVVSQSRGSSPDKPGWSKPRTHSNPTNLALFRNKITLYRFNQGAHTIAGGSQMGAGGWALLAPSL